MKTYTEEEEREIYQIAYKLHLENLVFAKENNMAVNGLCVILEKAVAKKLKLRYSSGLYKFDIESLPKFNKLNPYGVKECMYWWDRNDYEVRKKIFEEILLK